MEINYIDVNIHRNIDIEELLQRMTGTIREGVSNRDYKLVMMCEDAIAVINTLRKEMKRQHNKLVKQAELLNRGNEPVRTVPELCNGKPGDGNEKAPEYMKAGCDDTPTCFGKYDPTKALRRECRGCRFRSRCIDESSGQDTMKEETADDVDLW